VPAQGAFFKSGKAPQSCFSGSNLSPGQPMPISPAAASCHPAAWRFHCRGSESRGVGAAGTCRNGCKYCRVNQRPQDSGRCQKALAAPPAAASCFCPAENKKSAPRADHQILCFSLRKSSAAF